MACFVIVPFAGGVSSDGCEELFIVEHQKQNDQIGFWQRIISLIGSNVIRLEAGREVFIVDLEALEEHGSERQFLVREFVIITVEFYLKFLPFHKTSLRSSSGGPIPAGRYYLERAAEGNRRNRSQKRKRSATALL